MISPPLILAGYMAKRVASRPDWLGSPDIVDVYSVSGCISENFADYIRYWKHNGYWLFDSPVLIKDIAQKQQVDLSSSQLFFYEVFGQEFDGQQWRSFAPESSFATNVMAPNQRQFSGFDVVTFQLRTSPECSPLSCNSLAKEIPVNSHCLLESFENAKGLLEDGKFRNAEPGPYRIFAVYSVDWPK